MTRPVRGTRAARRVRGAAVGVLAALLAASGPAVARSACAGDCDADTQVTVDELVLGVNIALGLRAADACASMDGDADGTVSIDELVTAVGLSVRGCPATPTVPPSSTPTPTATPTTNLPPVIPPVPVYRTFPEQAVALLVGATDAPGSALRYQATNLPADATLDALTGLLSWAPGAEQIGAYHVRVTATDDGVPPLSSTATIPLQVSPLDACTIPACTPETGCTSTLEAVTTPCCAAGPAARVPEPHAECPQGRVMYFGRNQLGFGRMTNCDRFRITNFGQVGAVVRFNLELRCVRVDAPARLKARMETRDRLVFDDEIVVNLSPRPDGYAERLGVQFAVLPPTPFFDMEGAEANLTATLTDGTGATVSQQVRLVLTFDPVPVLPETP